MFKWGQTREPPREKANTYLFQTFTRDNHSKPRRQCNGDKCVVFGQVSRGCSLVTDMRDDCEEKAEVEQIRLINYLW